MAIILVVTDKSDKIIYRLPIREKISLGRLDTCTYPVADKNISKLHCTIEITEHGKVLFYDNCSTNGSLLNGCKITSHELKIGDVITIGNHSVRLDPEMLTPNEKRMFGMCFIENSGIKIPVWDDHS